MKKIPTLFERTFEGHKIVGITDKITPGCEDAFKNGVATVKYDGSCCAIINGVFYKRYDAKRGKPVPTGAIPCCDPDPVTGHWPHWVAVDPLNPADKWFVDAFQNYIDLLCKQYELQMSTCVDGTYEAVGHHFQANPYNLERDILIRHGMNIVNVRRDFNGVKEFLTENYVEGLVFWLNGEPICKIKRSDFGIPWNNKKGKK